MPGALRSSPSSRSDPFRDSAKAGYLGGDGPRRHQDETALAHAAAAGDGQAFATLYERYEGRAFNLALRITDSRDDAADATQDAFVNVMRRLPEMGDRELNFGSYLFTATRNACYDLIAKRKRADPTDEIPETAAPMAGGGGFGFDPGDPEDDPERGQLLDAQQEEIRAANARLPERQREVLALYELEDMSYDEIAEIMDMNRNSVAQLISRARIKLRDELRGTAMAAIAASTAECEQALPLIAMQDDGQLDADAEKRAWLAAHVAACDTCRLSREAMQEAGASYRCWLPVAAAPLPDEGDDGQGRRADRLGLERHHRGAGRGPRRRRERGWRGRRVGRGERAGPPPPPRRGAGIDPRGGGAGGGLRGGARGRRAAHHGRPGGRGRGAGRDEGREEEGHHKKKVKKDGTVARPDRFRSADRERRGSRRHGRRRSRRALGTRRLGDEGARQEARHQAAAARARSRPAPVDEPPVVEEPPGRTDDPQPCRPAGTRATC